MTAFLFALMLAILPEQHATANTNQAPSKVSCKEGEANAYYPVFVGDGSESLEPRKCVSGKWVLDEEAKAKMDAENAAAEAKEKREEEHRLYLWNALRTRVVTDAEMEEVLELGTAIIPKKDGGGSIDWCGGANYCSVPNDYHEQEIFYQDQAVIIFNNALLNQFKMRVLAGPAGCERPR